MYYSPPIIQARSISFEMIEELFNNLLALLKRQALIVSISCDKQRLLIIRSMVLSLYVIPQ